MRRRVPSCTLASDSWWAEPLTSPGHRAKRPSNGTSGMQVYQGGAMAELVTHQGRREWRDVGDHPCLSEDWLLENLPPGWTYDCQAMSGQDGFTIQPNGNDGTLFIPLDLLVQVRRR